MDDTEMMDLTLPFSVQTPQWANYEPLSIRYTKRVGGLDFGLGRNNAHCKASFHLASHMDGEKHFWAAGRTIGEVPLDYWHGPGVIVDISADVSDSSVYTPQMIEDKVDLQDGDILLIRTGYGQYGWNSPDSDEFRYMIKHPGPSPEFSDWCVERQIKWLGIDCVAMEHPMNTIQRVFHPKTFAEANQKLIDQFGKDWDEMFPLDKYYQDMHLNLFPKAIVHAENLGNQLAEAEKRPLLHRRLHPEGHGAGFVLGSVRGVSGRSDGSQTLLQNLEPGVRRIYRGVLVFFRSGLPGHDLASSGRSSADVEPLILGLPFFLFYLAVLLVGSFLVLLWLFLWEGRTGALGRSWRIPS